MQIKQIIKKRLTICLLSVIWMKQLISIGSLDNSIIKWKALTKKKLIDTLKSN